MKTWLITGCSTGLGASLAKAVLAAGDNAVVTARDASKLQELVAQYPKTALATNLDVTSYSEVIAAVKLATEKFGAVDVLVNNAGYGYRAAVEEGEDDQVEKLFQTNLFGPIRLIKAVLPQMRARRSGKIVNVSSIAARLAMPGSGYYASTKFALEGMSDALRREVKPLGIDVMIVEPGGFRTDFSGRSLHQSAVPIEDYAETAGARRKERDTSHGTQRGNPEQGAATILEVLNNGVAPFRLLLGSDAVSIVKKELESQQREIDSWEAYSLSTDFKD